MIETLIIGTGITSAFTAYLLALEGMRPVIVGDNLGHPPASFINPGGLNPLHGPGIPGVLSGFSLAAYQCHLKHWETIHRLSGIDFNPRIVQRLLPAFQSEDEQRLAVIAKQYQSTPGFSAQWLNTGDLHRLEPRLSSEICGGLLTQGNATVVSENYVQALFKAAQVKGARLIEEKVLALEPGRSDIRICLAGGKPLAAKKVVLATGAWSELWPDVCDKSQPALIPVKGEMLKIKLKGKPLPFDITQGKDGIYHLEHDNYWLGGTQSQSGFDFTPSPTQLQQITARIEQWLPGLSDHWELAGHYAALRPGTPDGFPLLGPLGDARLVGASGSGPKGMLWSAGLAAGVLALLQEKPLPLAQLLNPLRFKMKEKKWDNIN